MDTQKFITSIIIVLVAVIISLIFTYPAMLLWNWLMPMIFGLPTLTFWQTFGLCVLLDLLIPHSSVSSSN